MKFHGGPIATSVEEYEVPVEILSQFGRSTGQGANVILDTQDTSQPYETPMITSKNNHMEKHIYHILETLTEVEISCIIKAMAPAKPITSQ